MTLKAGMAAVLGPSRRSRAGPRRGPLVAALIAAAGVAAAAGPAHAVNTFLALGTGSPDGTYYPVGRSVCDLVNARRLEHGIRCLAYPSGGSVYNIQAIRSGSLELGMTRSDLAYQARQGEGPFRATGAYRGLRVVAALYSMPVAIIVPRDSDIGTFRDLPGHILNAGNQGSGKRALVRVLMDTMDWDRDDFEKVTALNTRDMGDAFCRGEVDVLVEALGHPAPFYERMIGDCGGRFVHLPEAVIKRLLKAHPSYSRLAIPGGLYPDTPESIKTFGFRAVLATGKRIAPQAIRTLARALFGDVRRLRRAAAALSRARPDAMLSRGITVPIHRGARAYYEAEGLPYRQVPTGKSEP